MTPPKRPEQPRLAMLWSHRIDIEDTGAALADVRALHEMERSPHPVEIYVSRTRCGHDPAALDLLDALAQASQTYGHVLHLTGAPGYVHEWWRAIHDAANTIPNERPELRLVDGGHS